MNLRKSIIFALAAVSGILLPFVWGVKPEVVRKNVSSGVMQFTGPADKLPAGYRETGGGYPGDLAAEFSFRVDSMESSAILFQTADSGGLRILADHGKITVNAWHDTPVRGQGNIASESFDFKLKELNKIKIYSNCRNSVYTELNGTPLSIISYPYLDIGMTHPSFGIVRSGPPPAMSDLSLRYNLYARQLPSTLFRIFAKPVFFVLFVVFGCWSLFLLSGRIKYGTVVRPAVLFAGIFFLFWGVGTQFRFSSDGVKGYYSELASGFAGGTLSIPRIPDPEHLSLPDPYDFSAAWKYKAWDLSLYKGKFYLYFGPVPALARLALFNIPTEAVMTVLYACATAFIFIMILGVIRRRWYNELPDRIFILTAASGVLNPLTLYLLSPHGVHGEAILASIAFVLGGFYFFLRADEEGRPVFVWTAGILLALGAGARASNFVPAAVLGLVWLFGAKKERFRMTAALWTPLAVLVCLWAVYNYFRFDNVLEMGVNYQLNSTREIVKAGKFFALSYIPVNMAHYLLSVPVFGAAFPFILPSYAQSETNHPVFSMALMAPLTLFVIPGMVAFIRGGGARKEFLCALASAFAVMMLVSANVVNTPRYMADFIWLFSVAGAASVFELSGARFPKAVNRTVFYSLAVALAVCLVFGFLLRMYYFIDLDKEMLALYMGLFS